YHLAIWHGFNVPLMMSIVALVGGVLVYSQRLRLFALNDRLPSLDAKLVFEARMQSLARWAGTISSTLRNGSLQSYTAWLLMVVALVLVTSVTRELLAGGGREMLPLDGVALLCGGMLIVAAILTTAL